jgi:hypothetical protein
MDGRDSRDCDVDSGRGPGLNMSWNLWTIFILTTTEESRTKQGGPGEARSSGPFGLLALL